LLLGKTLFLVDRIIEFRKTVADFSAGDNHLEAFGQFRVISLGFGQRAHQLRMIDQEDRAGDALPAIFPESISQTLARIALIFHGQFFQLAFYLLFTRPQDIDTGLALDFLAIVETWPFARQVVFEFSRPEFRLAKHL